MSNLTTKEFKKRLQVLHNIEQEERIIDEVYNDNSQEMQLMITGVMLSFGIDRDT